MFGVTHVGLVTKPKRWEEMTEVCLSLIKGNTGGTRPTAPKARRIAVWAAAVGAGEGVKSPPRDPGAASPNPQAADSTASPGEGPRGCPHVPPRLCKGRCTQVPLLSGCAHLRVRGLQISTALPFQTPAFQGAWVSA